MNSRSMQTAGEAFMEQLHKPDAKPLIMGIINTTPDSFFPKSRKTGLEALSRSLEFVTDGADIIDIGGESSRPGSAYISAEEEIQRVVPLIERIRRESEVPISVDTRKAEVARAAVSAGANIINDISALRDDPALGEFAAEESIPVILMHMQGNPEIMQKAPSYHNVVQEVLGFLKERIDFAQSLGIPCENIVVDPGIGFGKSQNHNLSLLKHLDEICGLGFPLLMGHSRKSFLGRILGGDGADSSERLFGSLAVVADSYAKGARIFRVHDVNETRNVLDVLYAIKAAEE